MNNVVIGAGSLGIWVTKILEGQGKSVTLVNRSGKVFYKLSKRTKVVAGDAKNPKIVSKICQDAGASTVYHCAMPPYTKWSEEFLSLTNGILEGAKQANCKLVFGDNLYGYGDTKGKIITENLPYKATGKKGKIRASMAELLLNEKDIKVVIGKGSDFYGPKVTNSTIGKAFFEAAFSGKKVNLLGNIDLPHTYTYIKDFASALVKLGESEDSFGQVWHIPNAPTITTRQFVKIIEEEIGKPIDVQVAGRKMVAFLGLFNPMLREVNEMMYEWEQDYVVSHEKYQKAFGDDFTSHEIAVKETVEWWRKNV